MIAMSNRLRMDPKAVEAFGGAESDDTDARPRCCACGHVLTSPRSLARAYGRVCWRRTILGQLERRRDAVGRSLVLLARRVGQLDGDQLAAVALGVDVLLDACAGGEVS